MRRTIGCVLLIVASMAVSWLLARPASSTGAGSASSTHTGPTIERVRELSELVTIRVDVADVQETTVAGHLGRVRVALILKGDFLLGIDLSLTRFEMIDAAANAAVLVLPAPRATSARVDHARTRVVHLSDEGLWVIVPGDVARGRIIDRAFGEAQVMVASIAADPALADRARRRAEQVLSTFFQATGWAVRVKWNG